MGYFIDVYYVILEGTKHSSQDEQGGQELKHQSLNHHDISDAQQTKLSIVSSQHHVEGQSCSEDESLDCIQGGQALLDCIVLFIVAIQRFLIFFQLGFLLLEVLHIKVIRKGLACHKIYVFLRLTKHFHGIPSPLRVFYGKDSIGAITGDQRGSKQGIRIVQQQSYAQSDIEQYRKEILRKGLQILFISCL